MATVGVTKLDRYVLREVAVPASLAFAVVSFVGVANELRERREALQIAQIALWDLARLVLLLLPTIVPYLLFITYMMGILMAFGRLTQHHEITAMKAAGIPLKRVALPVIVGGALLSIASFMLQDRVQPWSLRRATLLLIRELRERITLDVLPAGVMHKLPGDVRVFIGEKDPATGTLKRVHVSVPVGTRTLFYYGDEAEYVPRKAGAGKLILRNGHIIRSDETDQVTQVTSPYWEIEIPGPEEAPLSITRRMLDLGQLHKKEAFLERVLSLMRRGRWDDEAAADLEYSLVAPAVADSGADDSDRGGPSDSSLAAAWVRQSRTMSIDQVEHELAKTRGEIAERISVSLACLAVSVAAAPLVVRGARAGRSYAFTIGIGIALVWFVTKQVAQPRELCSLAVVVSAALVPDMVLGAVGAWALWRVDRV